MKPLQTRRLVIRNWRCEDAALFHRINADDRVMEFFPFRRNREQSDALMEKFRTGIAENGYGLTALELRETGECLGFCGLALANVEPFLPADAIEIGWRLAPEFWGKGYVTEAAEALLDFAFGPLGLTEIVSFAVWNNERSTAVMRRIGMRRDKDGDFDHPRVPDSHEALQRHVLYRITAADHARNKAV